MGGFRQPLAVAVASSSPDNHAMPSRVIVVEDDGFTRMLLAGQLQQLGYEVVGNTASAADALDLARAHRPDLALLDLDLGRGPTGIDLAHGLRRLLPDIGIVLLTSYADTRLTGEHRGLPPRAIALVKRTLDDAGMLDAALQLALDPAQQPVVGGRLPGSIAPRLSDGQAEILRLVANGFSNAEIGRRRHLTESAVVKAVARLIQQLGIEPRTGDNQRVLLAQAYFELAGTTGSRRD